LAQAILAQVAAGRRANQVVGPDIVILR